MECLYIPTAQPAGVPEILKKSLHSCSVKGEEEVFLIGKNFLKGTKVIFQENFLFPGPFGGFCRCIPPFFPENLQNIQFTTTGFFCIMRKKMDSIISAFSLDLIYG